MKVTFSDNLYKVYMNGKYVACFKCFWSLVQYLAVQKQILGVSIESC
jgi:hypothetical protein